MRFKLILCSFKFACLIDMSCCIIWVSSPLTGKALLNKTFNQMEQDLADELRFNMLLKSDPCKVSSVHCTIWGLWYWMSVSQSPPFDLEMTLQGEKRTWSSRTACLDCMMLNELGYRCLRTTNENLFSFERTIDASLSLGGVVWNPTGILILTGVNIPRI